MGDSLKKIDRKYYLGKPPDYLNQFKEVLGVSIWIILDVK